MTDIAISVQNLSKCYQIYENPRDRLKQFILPRLKRVAAKANKQYFREFWALKDVSFEIKKGETVGIIGRNGSGKSTLLQIICGTLSPTAGSIKSKGRIAALLELGSGFNPEFTGRENVYLNAALLGLTSQEVDSKFAEIEEFADIADFIDQPVKTYSSGMIVRLAFAVAINVEPEILIVDEALSVGDELFQRKCFSRIEAIKVKGATILFVSHSASQIIELCNRAILIDGGEVISIGPPKLTVGQYQKLLSAPISNKTAVREQIIGLQVKKDDVIANVQVNITKDSQALNDKDNTEECYDPYFKPKSTIAYESIGAKIEHAKVLTLDGERINNLLRGKTYIYSYKVRFELFANNVRFGMMIKTVSGLELGGAISASSVSNSINKVLPGSIITVEFKFKCVLNAGVYFMNAGVIGMQNESELYLHRLLDVEMFRVVSDSKTTSFGIVDFECVPEISFLS